MNRRLAALAAFVLAVAGLLFVAARPASAHAPRPLWPHQPHHWPTVYVEDHAGPEWRVPANVHRWGSGFRLGRCRPHAGCVLVWAADQGRNHGYIGSTVYGTVHGRLAEVEITLNAWCEHRQPPPVLWQATGHELGHALGLPHDRSGGVMSATDLGGAHITGYERRELAYLYGMRTR